MANRIPPPREFSWTRTIRTLSFWALLIAGSVALVQFASSRRPETLDLSYSQFTEQLAAGIGRRDLLPQLAHAARDCRLVEDDALELTPAGLPQARRAW